MYTFPDAALSAYYHKKYVKFQVSREEFAELWKDSVSDNWKILYMEFMFSLQDSSGDGAIDKEEFIEICTTFGVSSDECNKAFKIITKDEKCVVDFCYYSELWKEFFNSDDKSAIGNCIFGKIFMQ